MNWADENHRSPCAKCPYRKDAPLKLWHVSEFENLLAQDANEMGGHLFGCHNDGKKPKAEQRPCVGWLLDQRRRGTPSIQLRLALLHNPVAADVYERIHSKGLKLYPSISAMARANGCRRRPALNHEDLKLIRFKAWAQGEDPDEAERKSLKGVS